MEQIIAKMKDYGWTEVDGRIYHPSNGESFGTWISAIIACIDVASD